MDSQAIPQSGSGALPELTLFDASSSRRKPARKLDPDQAAELPIARVWVEAAVPQLDRTFDYIVPEKLSAEAEPGSKVRVSLAGQLVNGWIISREAAAGTDKPLRPLNRVLSAHPILTADHLRFLTTVAYRQMGMVSDLFRLAIPPRVAAVDSAFDGTAAPDRRLTDAEALEHLRSSLVLPPSSRLSAGTEGHQYLEALSAGGSPRAVAVAPRAQAPLMLEAVVACLESGRSAVVVVPDGRRMDEIAGVFQSALGSLQKDGGGKEGLFARLCAEDPPTQRYRSFLRVVYGHVDLVIGTRAAAYAPMKNLGLVALWDDGDSSLAEPRAPYGHARDVLIAKAVDAGCALLIASQSPTNEALRLAEIGWAGLIRMTCCRSELPSVRASGSEFEAARDRLAQAARIPSLAFAAARKALERGPVLVHVARAGYSPVVKCARCSERALCFSCQGPLSVGVGPTGKRIICSWCARPQADVSCAYCGSQETYQPVVGALRTAEELGRAFPGVKVVSSSGEKIRQDVPDEPALVVATPGAEPRVIGADGEESGYACALILDAEAMLARDSLHALEGALRRWFAVMALVRPEGEVVATVLQTAAMNALIAYDPVPVISRDFSQRVELWLPPASRALTLTGAEADVQSFWKRVRADLDEDGALHREPRVVGPTLLDEEDRQSRLLVLFSYQDAARISAAVRARRIVDASAKSGQVRVHCDPPEVL